MITILTSLWGLMGGGLMRLLPELVSLWNKKTDNGHELEMMKLQLEMQRSKAGDDRQTLRDQGEQDRLTIGAKSDAETTLALLDAQKAALESQMKPLGIWWVDALNFLVRPLTTYYFLGMYGLVKLATIMIAIRTTDPWSSIIKCWTLEDAAILSGILGFWFVGRVFDKKQ